MIEVLSKPAHQIGISDIESLIVSNVPEGEQIEFKESLSTEKDTVDPWMDGKGQDWKSGKRGPPHGSRRIRKRLRWGCVVRHP